MTVKYQAPTVKKAFSILNRIAAQKRGQGVSELATCLKISKSTVHGILTALDELGVVIRDPQTKRYSLGLTLFELGRAAYSRADLKDTARPFMEKLMAKVGESAFLGVKNGDHVTILDIVSIQLPTFYCNPEGCHVHVQPCMTNMLLDIVLI